MDKIFYREGIKYYTTRDYEIQTGIPPPFEMHHGFISYYEDGRMEVRAGMPWDGPSGPTMDTKDSMRGSLIHDCYYELMRAGLLNPDFYRKDADKLLRRLCIEDGMYEWRADMWYVGVREGAGPAADPKSEKPELSAP